MNLVKIVAIINWLIIAAVGFIAASEALSPNRGGGDAATRGLGQVPIIVLVVLLVLNLLPFNWTKYVALLLVALPVLLFKFWPIWQEKQRIAENEARYKMEDTAPIFEDQARDQLARAVRAGDLEKFKALLLQTPVERLDEGGALLDFAVEWASGANSRPAEKLECVRLLFEAGAKFHNAKGDKVPSHMAAAAAGDAVLLRLLLEQGADANAYQIHLEYAILFEAISSSRQPEAAVRALLEFGADPNARAVFDHEEGAVSPLWRAAKLERWGVCLVLLEHGADPDFKTSAGKTFRDLVIESERDFPANGFTTRTDYENLKKVLAQPGKSKRGSVPK
jgi:hypothetical protein